MLGHLSFGVRDLARARAFYAATLEPLGVVEVWSSARGAGFGPPGGQDRLALFPVADPAPPGPGFHLAFDAPDRAAVDAFHAAALAQGGEDLGGPGLRPQYGPTYYAAFVRDPDGHKLEAVHQQTSEGG
ncbi:MAG TPA: VOC family protein [Phenylobacterium sp.]|nr:VOC family protein [Phenylobacterium sp.]